MDIDNPITAVAEIFFPKNNAIALDAMLVKEDNKRNYGNQEYCIVKIHTNIHSRNQGIMGCLAIYQ